MPRSRRPASRGLTASVFIANGQPSLLLTVWRDLARGAGFSAGDLVSVIGGPTGDAGWVLCKEERRTPLTEDEDRLCLRGFWRLTDNGFGNLMLRIAWSKAKGWFPALDGFTELPYEVLEDGLISFWLPDPVPDSPPGRTDS
jgi:hypothetical protein